MHLLNVSEYLVRQILKIGSVRKRGILMRRLLRKLVIGTVAMSLLAGMSVVTYAAEAQTEQTIVTTQKDKKNKTDKKDKKTNKVKAEAQKVSKVTCTAAGKVNVSFRGKVTYTDSLKVTIVDEEGKVIECKIAKKNKALMSVKATGLVKGQKYTITIEGVLAKNVEEPATITKTFVAKGMKTTCKVKTAKVIGKKFVNIKTSAPAYYKDAVVTVKDSDGNVCEAKIIKKSRSSIKVQINGMKKGNSYTVTITGIKTKKEQNFSSITKTVKVK